MKCIQTLSSGNKIDFKLWVNKLTLADCINETIINELDVPEKVKISTVLILLESMLSFFLVPNKPSADTMIDYVSVILKNRMTWSILDFTLFSERVKEGRYQDKVKLYDRIDIEVINKWCACYEEERCEEVVKKNQNLKNRTDSNMNGVALLKGVSDKGELKGNGYQRPSRYERHAKITPGYAAHQIKKYRRVEKYGDGKINALYEFFERIGIINIPIEGKKRMYESQIQKGLDADSAFIACRVMALKQIIKKLVDTECKETIERYYQKTLKEIYGQE